MEMGLVNIVNNSVIVCGIRLFILYAFLGFRKIGFR